MRWDYLAVFIPINFVLSANLISYSHNYKNVNVLACPDNKICIPVDYCTDMMALLNVAKLPIHQFRQAICGYVGKNPKVCCNTPNDIKDFLYNNNQHHVETSQDCGKSLIRSSTPTLGSYPFLVRIGFINLYDGNVKYSCTGTIINERTILTTATCALATANDYKLHSVLVGEHDTAENPDCNQLFCAHCTRSYNISYVIKHPNFRRESFDYNIALIRLIESITFTLMAQPICYSNKQLIFMDSTFILIGWGGLSNKINSSQMQVFSMEILNAQECNEFSVRGLRVDLCTIGRQQPCSGFSGSPLIYCDEYGRFTVIGILSYGSSCNLNYNSPTVFVDVQKYAMWISDNS